MSAYPPPPQMQSQPYASTYQPPHAPADEKSAYSQGNVQSYGERFKPKRVIRDPFFLLLFLLTNAAFIAISAYSFRSYDVSGSLQKGNTGTSLTLNSSTAYLLLCVVGLSLLLSSLYLLIIRAFTKIIIEISLFLSVILSIAFAAYAWTQKSTATAILLTVFAVISIVSYFFMRKRIPLATLFLQVVIDIAKHNKSVYAVAFLGLLAQSVWSVFYAFAVATIYTRWTPGSAACASSSSVSCSSGTVAGLIFLASFSYLWTSQVIGNVCLATLAGGTFGVWYYSGPQQKHSGNMAAFGRSISTSLGSISFGSLIVTILEVIRAILSIARQNASQDGQSVMAILFCVAECCLGCIESLVQYFNAYAYVEIALFGKPYIRAAKDTWALMKDRGLSALVNDSLTGLALTYGSYAVGACSGFFTFLYLRIAQPSYNANGHYTSIIVFFAFAIGLQACLTMTSALEAGVKTIFVGLAEHPQVLAQRSPELFQAVANVYPQAVILHIPAQRDWIHAFIPRIQETSGLK